LCEVLGMCARRLFEEFELVRNLLQLLLDVSDVRLVSRSSGRIILRLTFL
jgi:hypothetical protein